MPWVWHGCIETATILNKAMLVFSTLRNVDNVMSKLMKKIIMWRIRNLYIRLPVELFAFDLLIWTYRKRLKIFSN